MGNTQDQIAYPDVVADMRQELEEMEGGMEMESTVSAKAPGKMTIKLTQASQQLYDEIQTYDVKAYFVSRNPVK